jgi:hypothetical protein
MENVFKASCPQPQSPAATKLKSESPTFCALTGTKISKVERNKTDVPAYNSQIDLPLTEIILMNVTFAFFIRTLLAGFYIKRIVASFSLDLMYLL